MIIRPKDTVFSYHAIAFIVLKKCISIAIKQNHKDSRPFVRIAERQLVGGPLIDERKL